MSKIPTAIDTTYPLADAPMSAVELAALYPHHTVYPMYMLRFHHNGWTMSQLATAQLYARNGYTKTNHTKRANALRKAKKTAGDNHFRVINFDATSPQFSGHADLRAFKRRPTLPSPTAQDIQDDLDRYNPIRSDPPCDPPRNITQRKDHPSLEQLVYGVVNLPTGNDEGIVTKVIRWAIENHELRKYTTEHIMTIANNPQNRLRDGTRLNVLPTESQGESWDQYCGGRVNRIPRPW